jgi:hypothetical protein
VRVQQARLPAGPPGPAGSYDLVVLSEVLYYLPAPDREQSLVAAEQAVGDDGDLVVVHWRHHPSDACVAGAAANEEVRERPGWRAVARHEESDFVLDVLTRR